MHRLFRISLSPGIALCALAQAALVQPAAAQVGADQLARPPAGALHYVIQSTGGQHGESWRWQDADGTRHGRESLDLRGQVWEMDVRGVPGADGLPASLEVRGVTPQGDAAETFGRSGEAAHWHSPVDAGESAQAAGRFYTAFGGPIEVTAWLAERAVASPKHLLPLLPGGELVARRLRSLEVQGRDPGGKRTLELWALSGLGNSPTPIWMNTDGTFFGLSIGIAWLPDAYAGAQQALEDAQAAALSAEVERLSRQLARPPRAPIAFTHVRTFDAVGLRFLDDQTVVVRGAKIVAVGAAAAVPVPRGARVIDGRGRTLLPGLWDCHMHVGDDYTGLQELSMGVTSLRDPGNDDARTIDRRTRRAAGRLLFPNVYPSSLIDGKGPYTAQVANVATSQAEAIQRVQEAAQKGFTGVKFYGTFDPHWLPAATAEAHRLGLHVHGHIPAGIRPLDAIHDGYDEITHINWIIMQAMPDSVIAVSNGIARFEGPGRYAGDVDLDGPAMQSLLEAMASHHIYSDPTMVAFESLYWPENGDLSPSYQPFTGTLPPAAERTFRQGGFAVPADLTRADYRRSWQKMVALLGRMREKGIPVVAGTDGSGIELVHELEIYLQAGYSPAQALATATIEPARLVSQAARTGSIEVGKQADLLLVEGNPARHMGDLRQSRAVVLGGVLLDADALRSAAGYSGRPHALAD